MADDSEKKREHMYNVECLRHIGINDVSVVGYICIY